MAASDNLGDYLTSIANAIRAKKGTSAAINAQDFATEIASISGGGGSYILINSDKLATLTCGNQSYTLTGDETEHAFEVQAGTYQCSASKGGLTRNKTVVAGATGVVPVSMAKVLPDIYQEVEYLQSDGTQYLILPISFKSSLVKIAINYCFLSGNAQYAKVFGSIYVSSTVPAVYIQIDGSEQAAAFGDVDSNVQGQYRYMFTKAIGEYTEAVLSNGVIDIDGVEHSIQSNLNLDSIFRIAIFAVNNSGTIKQHVKCRIKTFTIKVYDADVINLRPCYRISDSVAGMYHDVNGIFYVNLGSGNDFVVGPDKD